MDYSLDFKSIDLFFGFSFASCLFLSSWKKNFSIFVSSFKSNASTEHISTEI